MIVACKDYLNTHQNRNRGSNHRFFFGKTDKILRSFGAIDPVFCWKTPSIFQEQITSFSFVPILNLEAEHFAKTSISTKLYGGTSHKVTLFIVTDMRIANHHN
jgi:hypothetical protein